MLDSPKKSSKMLFAFFFFSEALGAPALSVAKRDEAEEEKRSPLPKGDPPLVCLWIERPPEAEEDEKGFESSPKRPEAARLLPPAAAVADPPKDVSSAPPSPQPNKSSKAFFSFESVCAGSELPKMSLAPPANGFSLSEMVLCFGLGAVSGSFFGVSIGAAEGEAWGAKAKASAASPPLSPASVGEGCFTFSWGAAGGSGLGSESESESKSSSELKDPP